MGTPESGHDIRKGANRHTKVTPVMLDRDAGDGGAATVLIVNAFQPSTEWGSVIK
jgi:hypothetical protein